MPRQCNLRYMPIISEGKDDCDSVHIFMQHCNDEKLFIRAKKNIPLSHLLFIMRVSLPS